MVKQRTDLLELVRKRRQTQTWTSCRRRSALAQAIIVAEVAAQIGPEHCERSPSRPTAPRAEYALRPEQLLGLRDSQPQPAFQTRPDPRSEHEGRQPLFPRGTSFCILKAFE